ncbi:DNA-directed RNA polymerase III subunit rpc9-like [Bidens hawaiensis]|uniref:DNA-directed RNA polymerase III subunit rpc9-like n=1 Tax=Bidens hawaiensis TaxID=980011 RepID=UPI004048F7F5
MKILVEHAGPLTNFEVLDFLKSRGAAKDPTRVLAPLAPSEFKVYDNLAKGAAASQTRESINEFVDKCKPYKLTKNEIVNIINIRPSSGAEIFPLIENIEERVENSEELVELVMQVFPVDKQETKSGERIKSIEESVEERNVEAALE